MKEIYENCICFIGKPHKIYHESTGVNLRPPQQLMMFHPGLTCTHVSFFFFANNEIDIRLLTSADLVAHLAGSVAATWP